jgi:molybdopterin molybdotransferase
MISVEAARSAVRERARPVEGTERVPLALAAGRVLAAPVRADRDDPPFDRATMDGYAVRAADLASVPRALRVVGRIAAGDAVALRVGPGEAAFVNTGAPMPAGADAVAPIEACRGDVEVLARVATGENVLRRGALVAAGDAVAEGLLTPERVAVCAACGADPVSVRRRPVVAVLATGSELSADPEAHQIRNSNGPMLRALFREGEVRDLGSVADDEAALAAAVRRGLEADLFVSTGGVSKGERDLVKATLEALGVEVVFHGVALQPGKPVLFGAHARGAVFALPGNPVSALVCADLFALPYLAAVAGRGFDDALASLRATLAAPARASPKRRRVFPGVLRGGAITPLPWRGSADLYTPARANAYFVLEPGADAPAGAVVECLVPERHAASVLAP